MNVQPKLSNLNHCDMADPVRPARPARATPLDRPVVSLLGPTDGTILVLGEVT